MTEYIEREKAMFQIDVADFVRDNDFQGGATLLFYDDVVDRLSAIPAADVRPVVRCKECKHYEQLDLFRNSPAWSGMCHYWNCHATREDGFCFKAAKREES